MNTITNDEIKAQIRGLKLCGTYVDTARADLLAASTSTDTAAASLRTAVAAMILANRSVTVGDLRAELKKSVPESNTKGSIAVAKGRTLKALEFGTTLADVAAVSQDVNMATISVADFDHLVTASAGLIQTAEAAATKATKKSKAVSPFEAARNAAMVASAVNDAAPAPDAAPVTVLSLMEAAQAAIAALREMMDAGDVEAMEALDAIQHGLTTAGGAAQSVAA